VYLALDAYYTARLYPDLWNECIQDDEERGERHLDPRLPHWSLLDTYERLLIPASITLADMEHHGVLLNREMFEESKVELEAKARKLQARIQRITGIKNFNPGSPKQVQQYIYAPPNGSDEGLDMPFGLRTEDGRVMHTPRRGKLKEGATAAPVLRTLAHRFPEKLPKTRNGAPNIIEDICEYRNLTKNIGTYVVGLLNKIDTDGRLRTSFNIAGSGTGRLSSSGPNLQNIRTHRTPASRSARASWRRLDTCSWRPTTSNWKCGSRHGSAAIL
jgi:DNA polymerase-1